MSRQAAPTAPGQRGYALLVVTIAIVSLLASGALLSIHLNSRMMLLRDQDRNFSLQTLLDSGYSQAGSALSANSRYAGYELLQINGGEVRVHVEIAVGGGGRPRGYFRRVRLYANYRGETRAAEGFIWVETDGAEPLFYGLEPLQAPQGEITTVW
ncbi:MAG: hypothetical protein AAF725_22070 [Acidobacteriota bacterium]